jgi:hypothetical protein
VTAPGCDSADADQACWDRATEEFPDDPVAHRARYLELRELHDRRPNKAPEPSAREWVKEEVSGPWTLGRVFWLIVSFLVALYWLAYLLGVFAPPPGIGPGNGNGT